MIQQHKTQHKEKRYSYADYLAWDEEAKYELINGKLYDRSPAPNRKHQEIVTNLILLLSDYYKKKEGKVYTALFDVRFPESTSTRGEEIYTVVQPDICVCCDLSKLDDKGAIGAPNLIVEILSPATAAKDLQEKYRLYEQHKVPVYWIVHPEEQLLEAFKLNDQQQYVLDKYYTVADKIKLDDTVKVNEVFA